jgi:hypothetical protein
MRSRYVHYFIITLLVVVAYLPVFTGDFVFDDPILIRDNSYITQLQSLSSYLSQEDDGINNEQDKGIFHTGYYRPLINITYFLDYKLWGMKAYGFRTTNLLLHLLACFLLYELLLNLTCRQQEVFWAVLLFAVHPMHTETVSIIVSRNNILVAIFSILSLHAYLIWWNKGAPLALAVSLFAFACAVFSKEFGLMVLPLFFLYQRILSEKKYIRREIESYIPYLFIILIYLILRKTVVQIPLSIPDDIFLRIAYIPYLVFYNLKLIFLPYNMHSFSVVYPTSLLSPAVVWSFLLLLPLAIFLYVRRKDSLVIFSAASFIVTLLPVLNIINKASVSLIAMRWLYMPMTFLTFGFVPLIMKVKLEEDRGRGVKQFILLVAAVYLVAGSYTLNAYLWHDQETFLQQEVLHFANELYMGDYAEMLLKKKQYRKAEPFFQQSLKKSPLMARNFINYGALLVETGRPQEALEVLEKARSITMGHKDRFGWNNNMGAALTLMGNYKLAHEHIARALALEPLDVAAKNNLAYLLQREKQAKVAHQ